MAAGHRGPVAIAVSGGSDSLALMLLAAGWARRSGRRLHILTVDHALRPEAAAEAESVRSRAEAMGLDAQILRWTGESASQAHARRGRHKLLAKAAREAGAGLILLGHTADDLEETVLMRLARGSSLAGAAGLQYMSVSPVWPEGSGLLLGRPLLGLRRRDLQDWLTERGEDWVSDPSNLSLAYERVQTRLLIAELCCPDRLARIAQQASLLRACADETVAIAFARHVGVDPFGLVSLDCAACQPSAHLLSVLLQAASGVDRPSERGQLENLAETVRKGGPATRLTLGGAWIQRRGNELLIGRDPGEADRQWTNEIWDGRYVRDDTPPDEARYGPPPFLVRASLPEGGYGEIVSARLNLWTHAMRRSAELTAEAASGLPDAAAEAGPDITTERRGKPLL